MGVNDNNDSVTTVESSVNVVNEINTVGAGRIDYSSEIYNNIMNLDNSIYYMNYDYRIDKIWDIPSNHKNIIIEGNNHTIYGNGMEAFNITGYNVTIKTLTLLIVLIQVLMVVLFSLLKWVLLVVVVL